MVFYFSGTGNSKYIANRIRDGIGCGLLSINDLLKKDLVYCNANDDLLIFSVPTYAWRIPHVVEDWIRRSEFKKGAKAYFIMNCGGEIGNAEKYLRKLCKDCSLVLMGCGEIVMPENYLAMFSTPTPEQGKKIIARAEPVIDSIIDAIKNGDTLPSHKASLTGKAMSSIVNALFYPLCVSAKKFTADDKCISCGKCVKECPLNNVTLKDGRPVWGKECTHCMACISICPKTAIEYGKNSVNRPKYRCPY
ncbi:MAG: EFR1 family ferrodoxin [Clostridia bacterium]|nr:EFR1 family ferrodoxin [Clostridia bacterium]